MFESIFIDETAVSIQKIRPNILKPEFGTETQSSSDFTKFEEDISNICSFFTKLKYKEVYHSYPGSGYDMLVSERVHDIAIPFYCYP